ncbi:MAG TPA: hypothetical protein VFU44_12205 [Candidatus Limnocylindria bacterium]|jgi:hypothetical protein|nr:hypothetical protein [Candidatus Limnocylindria bacterium]
MSADRDTTRIVRSWLEDGVTRLPDHVLDAVLDELPSTPQRRATWWPARRLSTMNTTLKFGLAAVVVAVALLIGLNYLAGTNVGGPDVEAATPTPVATSTPEPTATPPPSPSAETGGLPEGTYVLWNKDPVGTMNVTIPAPGWFGELQGGILIKNDSGADPPDGAGLIVLGEAIDWLVPTDPCNWESTLPETPATTVDQLVAGLSAQESREASDPTDVTVGGHAGFTMTLQVPDDADFGGCDHGQFCTIARESVAREGGCQRFHQGPGQIDKLWIVDVDGVPVIIDAGWYDETPPEHVDELEAIVASTTFGD